MYTLTTYFLREVVKKNPTMLEQPYPPNHKIDGGLCPHFPSSTSRDDVFIALPPFYSAVKNDNEIEASLFLFI